MANLLTLGRFLLSFPFYFFLWHIETKGILPPILLGIAIVITDVADGYAARKRDEITKLGSILDPVLDKIIVDVSLIILVLKSYISFWWVLPLFVRDGFLAIIALILLIRQGVPLKPTITGKLTPFIWSIAMFLLLLRSEIVAITIVVLANIFVIISGINYGRICIRQIKRNRVHI